MNPGVFYDVFILWFSVMCECFLPAPWPSWSHSSIGKTRRGKLKLIEISSGRTPLLSELAVVGADPSEDLILLGVSLKSFPLLLSQRVNFGQTTLLQHYP